MAQNKVLIEGKRSNQISLLRIWTGNTSFLQKAEKMGARWWSMPSGDNAHMLKKLVPKFEHLIQYTQVMPVKNVHNFRGFTDSN